MFFHFVTKHACDGHTDGQTELRSYDRAGIAASCGKNSNTKKVTLIFRWGLHLTSPVAMLKFFKRHGFFLKKVSVFNPDSLNCALVCFLKLILLTQ